MRCRFGFEAVLLGVAGLVLGLGLGIGIAVAETAWSTALFWGLSLPAGQLALAVGLGILATVVAASVPILRGRAGSARWRRSSRCSPVRSGGGVRGIGGGAARCSRAGLGPAALSVAAPNPNALLIAIGAGALISVGVLFGGPLFVPSLLSASGRLFRWTGTVPRLAAGNAERNPRRATATATALMLAVGLMVTLQVATASVRLTVLDQLAQHYPVDLQVSWGDADGGLGTIPDDVAARLDRVPGVEGSVRLAAATGSVGEHPLTLLGWDARIPDVTGVDDRVGDDRQAGEPLPRRGPAGHRHRQAPAGSVELTVVASPADRATSRRWSGAATSRGALGAGGGCGDVAVGPRPRAGRRRHGRGEP